MTHPAPATGTTTGTPGPPWPLRRHQAEALAAVDRAREQGAIRYWVTMPPGAGKTLVGTEVARLLGRPAVVFSPNTAIQGQWARTWELYDGHRAGTSRDLTASLTSLTYQSLAVFERDSEQPDEPDDADPPGPTEQSDDPLPRELDRLHPNGRALVEALRAAGPITVVLDECHHLLEVWGRLLADVLAELPEAVVLGLTATPPGSMTRNQAELTDELFGPVLYEARIPALVKEGTLAPFAELAWLVEPTTEETDWIAEQTQRFSELTADLFSPDFGSTPLPAWLDQRFVRTTPGGPDWATFAAESPELCDAALRMSYDGLLATPPGAVLHERHRRAPEARDWVLLIEDWLLRCIVPRAEHDPADRDVLAAVRHALPAIGFVWTRRGMRVGTGTVDRVTARSAAKQQAVATILAGEWASLGEDVRGLVLCDFEQATATVAHRARRRPDGESAPPQPSGSALGVLRTLLDDEVTAALEPVLVTGRTVAASPATLHRLREFVAQRDPSLLGRLVVEEDPDDGISRLVGAWHSGRWVGHVTAFFAAGMTRTVIGTRGLLGEGWDAPAITTLVDLTTATTTTAVVQTRGRALRVDRERPDKVALIWSVVCVSEQHVAGGSDWHRFVRKHTGYFTIDEHGTVTDGVAGVDSSFSDFHPPAAAEFATIDARMLVRAQDRPAVARAWAATSGHTDTVRQVVRIRSSRDVSDPATSKSHLPTSYADRVAGHPGAAWLLAPLTGVGAAAVALGQFAPALAVLASLLTAACCVGLWGRSKVLAASRDHVGLGPVAAAVADALHVIGRTSAGAEALRVEVTPDGGWRFSLDADETSSAAFAEAVAEVAAPMADPRYVISRWVVSPPAGLALRRGLASLRGVRPDGQAWHAVPSALAGRRQDADAFAAAWRHWVGGGPAVYAHSPEGAGVLAATRGADPFSVTCVVRREWT